MKKPYETKQFLAKYPAEVNSLNFAVYTIDTIIANCNMDFDEETSLRDIKERILRLIDCGKTL